jgi:anti-sigma B factor antagonist
MGIKVSTRQVGDVTVVDISGRMIAGSGSQEILMSLVEEFDQGHRWLLVNCADLTFVDSSGIGDILAAHAAIIRRGGVVRLLNPTRTLRDSLERTRLDSVLDVYQDEAAALASFNAADNERTQQKLAVYLQRAQ